MISILIPCLGRPESIARLKQNHRETQEQPSELVFIVSPHDSAVVSECVSENVRFLLMDRQRTRHDYSKKMNYAYSETKGEWLLLGAQDIKFHEGWDTAALMCATATKKRVIGTNDLGNPEAKRTGSFSTHPLVARSYVEEHGTIDDDGIVSEVYDHNWVDRELAETAAYRGEWAYCKQSIVEHLHFHWGKGVNDATYKKGMRHFGRDRMLFYKRRPLWGLPSSPAAARVTRTGGRVRSRQQ